MQNHSQIKKMNKKKLKIRAGYAMMLGYGHVAGNLTKALDEISELDVSVIPISIPHITTKFDRFDTLINKVPDRDTVCLSIWHEFALIENALGSGKQLAYPFFEVNELDDLRKRNLNYVDQIIVASKWGREVLENNGIHKPIEVISPGVDSSIFYPGKPNDPNSNYIFLNIGKFEERKSTKLIADLFNRAFEPTDNVELWFHCDAKLVKIQKQLIEFVKYCTGTKMGARIKFSQPVQTDIGLANIIRGAHCGIFLTRAEGFGLPILQSIACGKPIISTNYSGHSEFVNSSNSLIVPISRFVPARDNIWFSGLGTWADIDKNAQDITIEHMRNAYKNRLVDNYGVAETIQKFTWKNAAAAVFNLI